MSWDPFQREMLEALGHTLYAPAVDALPQSAVTPPPNSAAPPLLLQALARAALVDADALPRVLDLHAPPVDPAAKRALWPRLRRLRASASGP